MTLSQTITNSYSSLLKQKVRSLLTILAVSVGIGIVIIVLSSGEGMKAFVNKQLESFGSDLVQVEVKVPSVKHTSSANAIGMAMGISITTLKGGDLEAILKLPNVKNGYAFVMDQELVSYKNSRKKITVAGVTAQAPNVDKGIKLAKGNFFFEEDDKSLSQFAILGSSVSEKLFGEDNPIGKFIKIKRKNFRVIGVLEERGAVMGMDFDNQIYMPLKTLQKKIMGIDYVNFMPVQVKDLNLVEVTEEDIRKILRSRHNIPGHNPDRDDFAVVSMVEAREMIDKVFGGITLLLLALAAISLVVGGVGIMNIMYVSVTERMYEIGLRKAVGAKNNDILRQFLFEAVILTFSGGLLGIAGGTFITFLVTLIANYNKLELPFVFSINSVIIGCGFAILLGLFFGIYPAKKASKLDPIVALTR